jgi:uncharacterized membrane-anchored protein YhcB (DUF1043 family)
MNTHDAKERAQDLLRETDNQIRANPIPAVLMALGVGIAIGLLSRLIEPPARRREPLHDALDDIRSLLATGARKGRSAYAHSAEAVRDAVEKARDIDVDPVAKWWKRIWS